MTRCRRFNMDSIMDTTKIVITLIEKTIELAYVGLLAYISRQVFSYMTHRLDVLGKDAVLFYRREQSEQHEANR